MEMEPWKLAVKYNPPKLALFYQKGKELFVHEFPITMQELESSSDRILASLDLKHPGYLNKVQPTQVFKLLDMLRQKLLKQGNQGKPSFDQRHKGIDLAEINRDIDDMDLYSPSEDDSEDDNFYNQVNGMDFREIDRELAEDSDSDFTDDDMMDMQ